MLKQLSNIILGTKSQRFIKKSQPLVEKINSLENQIINLSDDELKSQSLNLKNQIAQGKTLDQALPESFALAREAAKRTLGMRHFDVQLLGGVALHQGNISEMKTGEGKTLVSTLPAYLNALSGNGVHMVTVNDYLAKRDFEWMRSIYQKLGLTVGCVTDATPAEERIAAYNSDITYVNNSTLGFDYLRDNMKPWGEELFFKRPFNFAIVDEADSILIDEARTPLIISGPSVTSSDLYQKIDTVIRKLTQEDYILDEESHSAHLTESGVDKVEHDLQKRALLQGHLYNVQNFHIVNHINQALKAHKLFHKNKDYMIIDRKVVLIDEFTGRVMDGRRYSEGLHQAIEAKEGVQIQMENQTMASITYQNLFRMYKKLAGMTGTAMTEAEELSEIYHVEVMQIPTNKIIARQDLDDLIFLTNKEKYTYLTKQIKEINDKGQPILLGTTSVEKSEELSKILKKEKIKHEVLNAKHHEKEAKIIANAGRLGAVTIATNMAGRGTDIMLGGNIKVKIETHAEHVKKSISADDIAQITAQHEEEKKQVMQAGGLFVIGTERHESRRIDDQLRGRSGRQGDPGNTQFFLSLEDDLLRIFGGEKIKNVVSRLGFKPGEAMNHAMLNRVIRYSQKRIESMHYDIRKNILRYDDIANQQRLFIYGKRNAILDAKNTSDILPEIVQEFTEAELANYLDNTQSIEQNHHFQTKMEDVLGEENSQTLMQNLPKNDIITVQNLAQAIMQIIQNKIQKDAQAHGEDVINGIVGNIMLSTIDETWRNHINAITALREGIHLRAYAQKDPLNEYKTECYKMFDQTVNTANELTINRILRFIVSD